MPLTPACAWMSYKKTSRFHEGGKSSLAVVTQEFLWIHSEWALEELRFLALLPWLRSPALEVAARWTQEAQCVVY